MRGELLLALYQAGKLCLGTERIKIIYSTEKEHKKADTKKK